MILEDMGAVSVAGSGVPIAPMASGSSGSSGSISQIVDKKKKFKREKI